MLGKIQRIHFVGIGGIGMSGIAELLLNQGFQISGSDAKPSPVTERLARLGARVEYGHDSAHLRQAQVVVVSSAVNEANPEIVAARARHIPVIPRAEMLTELMRMKFSIAVAGAHGKTTVTSMVAVMLTEAGLDPTAVIGGRLDVFGSSARLGKGELLVAEADESDRSFLLLLPSIAVITNIDREHLDHYRDLDEIRAAFLSFMNKVPFYGAVIACWDAPWRQQVETLLPQIRRRLITYGLEPGARIHGHSVSLTQDGSCFQAREGDFELGTFCLKVPGRHNVQNALAAIAVGLELSLNADQIRKGLERFGGADRRFQNKLEVNGIRLIDDYGHHPVEIRATLEAARAQGAGRIWAIFQPHRYTRTQHLMDDFARAFDGCERVYVLDVYAASEAPIAGVNSERLAARMRELGLQAARYAPSEEAVVSEVAEQAQPGVLIMTIGAGSVGKLSDTLANVLAARFSENPPVAVVTGEGHQ